MGRIPYLLAGVGLFAVKIAVDRAVAGAFSQPYSPLMYISPTDAPLFRPRGLLPYWWTLWAVALPFLAIGFVLTLRRLRDAGLSPWLSLLFFAPFANLLFFAFLALVPGVGAAEPPAAARAARGRLTYTRAAVLAAAAGALVGLAAIALSSLPPGSYGPSLFVGAPVIGGFISGLSFARWHSPRLSGAMLAALLSVPLAGMVVVLFAWEGLACLAMAFPLVMIGSLFGAGMACLLARSAARAGGPPAAAAFLLLPLGFLVERAIPLPASEPRPVQSALIVDAPIEAVWRDVIAFPPLAPPTEWIFRIGVAAPLSATIDTDEGRPVRRCVFTTGTFVEPVTTWSPPHMLSFDVASAPDPLREWTLWAGSRPPHLDGFLESTRGQFVLEPLPGGRTRLTGRTWYRTNMYPERYWRLWADPLIHAIHLRVLRHVASLAEAGGIQP